MWKALVKCGPSLERNANCTYTDYDTIHRNCSNRDYFGISSLGTHNDVRGACVDVAYVIRASLER